MKKSIITSIICLMALLGHAQTSLQTENYRISSDCSYPVILPTVDNLIRIVNMDVYTFKSTMAKYHYHQDETEAGPSYVYTNESIDFYLYENNGRGVNFIMFDPQAGNNKFAGFQIFKRHAFPSTCIPDLYQELAQYYTKSENGVRYYALRLNGYDYGIRIIPISGNEGIVVQIYKFGK